MVEKKIASGQKEICETMRCRTWRTAVKQANRLGIFFERYHPILVIEVYYEALKKKNSHKT
jgi:hypothetical protein